jgi:hypothetical protein
VATAGDYQIQGWVYTDPVGGFSDSFFVTVDDQPAAGFLWDVQENTTYLPDLVCNRIVPGNCADVVVTLSAGQHIVSVHHREDGTRLDRLELIPIGGPANQPPVVTNPGDQSNVEGDSVTLNITASDPDGDVLTFSASGLPAGLSINASTGQIAGTLTFESAGVYNVTVTVSDGTASISLSFQWTVNNVKRASKDDEDDDGDDDPPPVPPSTSQVSTPSVASAPTPSVLYLPETGIGGYSEHVPTVWPVIVLPGLGILLGWVIYQNLNIRQE